MRDKNEHGADRCTANEEQGMQREAVTVENCISVITVIWKEEINLVIEGIALSQSRGKITLHRNHRISSVKRHHLE